MRKLLEAGTTLIVDRYSYSGVAFTAAKGLDFEWCRGPEKGLPEPDAILFLDMSIDEAKKRGDFGMERYEREEFQQKVRAMYQKLKDASWITVDAARTVEQVHADLTKAALDVIANVHDKPIKGLWV